MADTIYKARVQQKRDTAANWEKVKNTFQPLDGELIIVDTSAGKTRFKVGRYDTTKNRLLYYGEIPFADEYLYNDANTAIGKVKDYVDDAVANAGMSHPLILQENTDYGDTLPASPQTGQLFFKEAGASLFDLIYPVGAVYISMNNTSPATLFGGSWTKVEGKFLLGTSSAYPSGSSGGEETHTLTVNEMPSHKHTFYLQRGSSTGEKTALLEWVMSSQVAGWQPWQTDGTGGGQAHNNMPPYLSVNIWYRTA